MATYATVADMDLYLGTSMMLPAGLNKTTFLQAAADEMDAKLGFVYVLPLDPIDTTLPRHQTLLLKHINARLAAGRLLLTLAMPGEDNRLHAYAINLVRSAEYDLAQIASIDTHLLDVELVPVDTDAPLDNKTPVIIQHDEESLLLGFENTVMRGVPWWSRPGAV